MQLDGSRSKLERDIIADCTLFYPNAVSNKHNKTL